MAAIMRDEGQPAAARVSAVNSLLDRAIGKPKQVTTIAGSATDPIIVELVQFTRAGGGKQS